MSLKLNRIDVEKAFDCDFEDRENVNVYCPFHEDEEESRSKSCSVGINGTFSCKGCGKTGTAVDFYIAKTNCTKQEAVDELRLATVRKTSSTLKKHKSTLSEDIVTTCVNNLASDTYAKRYLKKSRGLSPATIRRFRIGKDEHRITIPIHDINGELVNIRRYLPNATNGPKMASHVNGDGSPALYPIGLLHDPEPNTQIIVCEGEFDCLLLNQSGFTAITNTGNVRTWSREWTQYFANLNVVIIFDVNDKEDDLGQRMAKQRAEQFIEEGIKTKVVRLPLPDTYIGGDVTNYLVDEGHTAEELQKLIDNTPEYTPTLLQDEVPTTISLHEAADAKHFHKPIKVKCLVAGKGEAPFLVPKEIELEVEDTEGNIEIRRKVFQPDDNTLLTLINCTEVAQRSALRALCGVPKSHSVSIEILETMNVEELHLIPAIDANSPQGEYVMRQCYYVGNDIRTNNVYDFKGYTLPHPKTQQATHLFTKAEPAATDIESFELTQQLHNQLCKTFQSKDVHEKLQDIAKQLSAHVTHIYGRSDLHMAVDLVYHSPLQFHFDGTLVHKGWLECFILGDTRTGKGFVTENLVRHYGAGEVVSGENVTLAGLLGGIQKLGERNRLVWGKIPLATGRLVVIDECGSLSHSDIAKMSRVRSEGVLEITKVVTEVTRAQTRLIWVGNPVAPSGSSIRMIGDYNYGIEAVPDVIGAAEDIARYDFVLVVTQDEVSSNVINSTHKVSGRLKYKDTLCKALVTWIWSRKPEQVHFADGTVALILKAARALGKRFTPRMNLIQAEDVRFKLARIAAAAAGRLYSTEDGENLLVNREHVQFAYNFLLHIYGKPGCGYAQLSVTEKTNLTLRDVDEVKEILESVGDDEEITCLLEVLMEHRIISPRDLADATMMDYHQARDFVGDLVKYRALVKERPGTYKKRPAFKTLIEKMRGELAVDPHLTQE